MFAGSARVSARSGAANAPGTSARSPPQTRSPARPSDSRFGLDVVEINDAAVRATDEARYAQLAAALQQLGADRNGIAHRMRTILEQVAFADKSINKQAAKRLIAEAEALLARAGAVAASSRRESEPTVGRGYWRPTVVGRGASPRSLGAQRPVWTRRRQLGVSTVPLPARISQT